MGALDEKLRQAEETHLRLRAANPGSANLDEKAVLLREILSVLEEARCVLGNEAAASPALRQALLALRVDAEFHAGRQTEAEGYRNAADVLAAYQQLRRACP